MAIQTLPSPLNVFNNPKKSLLANVAVIAVVSINGIVINVPILNTSKIASVIPNLCKIVVLLKTNFND